MPPAHQSVIGPTPAANAVVNVRRKSHRCKAAAPAAPNAGISRVFAWPATGALAMIATPTATPFSAFMACAGNIAVGRGQFPWISTKKIAQAQSPHQPDGAPDSLRLPTPPRDIHPLTKANRRRYPSQTTRQRDVFHQGNFGKSANGPKCCPRHKHGLVTGGNAGKTRTPIHQRGNQRKPSRMALDDHIETPPCPPCG